MTVVEVTDSIQHWQLHLSNLLPCNMTAHSLQGKYSMRMYHHCHPVHSVQQSVELQ